MQTFRLQMCKWNMKTKWTLWFQGREPLPVALCLTSLQNWTCFHILKRLGTYTCGPLWVALTRWTLTNTSHVTNNRCNIALLPSTGCKRSWHKIFAQDAKQKVDVMIYNMSVSCFSSAGCVCLHNELHDVHLLGSALLFAGCHAGQGLRSIRLWLRNTRGETALKITTLKKGSIQPFSAFFASWHVNFYTFIDASTLFALVLHVAARFQQEDEQDHYYLL